MILLFLTLLLLGLGWVVAVGVLGGAQGWLMFPIGGLMVLPLIFFSWRETMVFVLLATLLWESFTPMVLGSVAMPLLAVVMLLQLLARHQFRANGMTRAFCAVVLQSVVTLTLGMRYPPRTIAGTFLQMGQTMVELALAAAVALLWVWLAEKVAEKYFNINFESRLKDL